MSFIIDVITAKMFKTTTHDQISLIVYQWEGGQEGTWGGGTALGCSVGVGSS